MSSLSFDEDYFFFSEGGVGVPVCPSFQNSHGGLGIFRMSVCVGYSDVYSHL
jgi:hypothetical protein